jgi:alkylation response protein AidB-like acyl-CoA dehydrogenase
MNESMYDDDLKAFRESFKKFIEKEVKPFHAAWEREGAVSREVWEKAGAAGFLCIPQSTEYGGAGLPFRYAAVVQEELSRAHASGVAFSLHSDIVAPYIENFGTDEQKKRWLPGMAAGKIIGAIAMTEPGTGSDLQGIQTRAVLDGDEWVINGTKTFISNGQLCDLTVVVCRTEDADGWQSQSLIVVPSTAKGFVRGKKLEKMGMHAQDTSEMHFEDCRVPKDHLLGERGQGFLALMRQLGQERLIIAIASVAGADETLKHTIEYCKDRKAFGKPIAVMQNTKFRLAEMATEIKLGETFVDSCIQKLEKGETITVEASMAKYWCSEMLGRTVDGCLQLFGGYGYMMEYPIAKAYLDARVQRIYGGTTEIMKEIISRSLIG